MEIACGHGRNTELLARVALEVICTDPLQECIDKCAARFRGRSTIKPLRTSGFDLSNVKSEYATLVYSFDSMVHFEPEIVEAYVAESARVLKKNGAAFMHVSNWTGGYDHDFRTQPHWRNFMSQDLMKYFAKVNGLKIESAQVISWDESLGAQENLAKDLDCLYVLRKI